MTRASACNWGLSSQQSNKVCSSTNCRYDFRKPLRIVLFNLTPKFEPRKSCWELCDSQRVCKSQVLDVFVRNSLVLAKQPVVCDKTTRCSCYFKGNFSDYVPRNLFFFLRDFENVRRNFISDVRNRGNVGENRDKL